MNQHEKTSQFVPFCTMKKLFSEKPCLFFHQSNLQPIFFMTFAYLALAVYNMFMQHGKRQFVNFKRKLHVHEQQIG